MYASDPEPPEPQAIAFFFIIYKSAVFLIGDKE